MIKIWYFFRKCVLQVVCCLATSLVRFQARTDQMLLMYLASAVTGVMESHEEQIADCIGLVDKMTRFHMK